MATILLNGLFKDYSPPGGIAAYGTGASAMVFDPTAQVFQANASLACPQGDGGGFTVSSFDIGTATDPGFAPRAGQGDDGFYATVASSVGGRFFATNIKATGTSGSVAPSAAGLDGSVFWWPVTHFDASANWRGARANGTLYATHDYISVSGAIWQCISGGTSAGSPPAGYGTAQYNGTVFDGGALFFKIYRDRGAWVALTAYGVSVQDTNTHLPGDAMQSGGVLYIFAGATGTNATTGGSEPAWTAATGSQKYWLSGNVIFIQGKDLFGNPGSGNPGDQQTERLILTGLAAGSNGQTVTIQNAGGSLTDVVISDKLAMIDATHFEAKGTDVESAAANKFDCGGTDVRIAGGTSADFKYNSGTGFWVYQAGGGMATKIGQKTGYATPVAQKTVAGYTKVAANTDGGATAVMQKTAAGYTSVSGK